MTDVKQADVERIRAEMDRINAIPLVELTIDGVPLAPDQVPKWECTGLNNIDIILAYDPIMKDFPDRIYMDTD